MRRVFKAVAPLAAVLVLATPGAALANVITDDDMTRIAALKTSATNVGANVSAAGAAVLTLNSAESNRLAMCFQELQPIVALIQRDVLSVENLMLVAYAMRDEQDEGVANVVTAIAIQDNLRQLAHYRNIATATGQLCAGNAAVAAQVRSINTLTTEIEAYQAALRQRLMAAGR